MEETTPRLLEDKKSIGYIFAMLALIIVVAVSTYGILFTFFKPNTLSIPQNVAVNDASSEVVLSWNHVKKADSYTVLIINRTTGDEITIFIYETMYTVDEDNKIEYDITSEIDENYNYAIMVKANHNESSELSSEFSQSVELSYVDNSNDVRPYVG